MDKTKRKSIASNDTVTFEWRSTRVTRSIASTGVYIILYSCIHDVRVRVYFFGRARRPQITARMDFEIFFMTPTHAVRRVTSRAARGPRGENISRVVCDPVTVSSAANLIASLVAPWTMAADKSSNSSPQNPRDPVTCRIICAAAGQTRRDNVSRTRDVRDPRAE